MKLKNLFRRAKKEDRTEKAAKTKTAAAEMILDDEVLQMLSGGVQRGKVWPTYYKNPTNLCIVHCED